MQVIEYHENYDFPTFYDAYGFKRNKTRAAKIWKDLKPHEQVAAFLFIPRYKERCKRDGAAIKYPDTYLHEKPWND